MQRKFFNFYLKHDISHIAKRNIIRNSFNFQNIEIQNNIGINLNILLRQSFRSLKLYSNFIGIKYFPANSGDSEFVIHNNTKLNGIIKPLFNAELKLQELFEMSDKSKYLAANLVSVDFTEMCTLDNYKEAYPLTSFYAKCQRLLKYRDYYIYNTADFEKEEIDKCFVNLENYVTNYDNIFLLSSYAEELKNVIQRLYVQPQKRSLKLFFSYNSYDTMEKVHSDLKTLCENYKILYDSLHNYPAWQRKLEVEIGKLFAYSNIADKSPEVYAVLVFIN